MSELVAMAAASASKEGLLKLVYQDLAQPGVQQVGIALKSVMALGNTALLPIRLLNETAKAYEYRKFHEIANRFREISEEEIVETAPELGVPIMERLSYSGDKTIRLLFIELLAKASSYKTVALAHPSFINVISSICPDEALLLQSLGTDDHHPMLSIDAKDVRGSVTLKDFVLVPPSGLSYPDRIPLYVSNLVGLGIIEIRRDVYLTDEHA